jgi:lipopolysaccharide transport system permease protein
MAALAALGPGLYFAAMTVKYRDFRIVIPFALQFGLYISPVGFSSTLIPELWRPLYSLNPVVGIIDGFRWSILGGARVFDWQSVLISAVVIALMLWLGLSQFRKSEASLVDAI